MSMYLVVYSESGLTVKVPSYDDALAECAAVADAKIYHVHYHYDGNVTYDE